MFHIHTFLRKNNNSLNSDKHSLSESEAVCLAVHAPIIQERHSKTNDLSIIYPAKISEITF